MGFAYFCISYHKYLWNNNTHPAYECSNSTILNRLCSHYQSFCWRVYCYRILKKRSCLFSDSLYHRTHANRKQLTKRTRTKVVFVYWNTLIAATNAARMRAMQYPQQYRRKIRTGSVGKLVVLSVLRRIKVEVMKEMLPSKLKITE